MSRRGADATRTARPYMAETKTCGCCNHDPHTDGGRVWHGPGTTARWRRRARTLRGVLRAVADHTYTVDQCPTHGKADCDCPWLSAVVPGLLRATFAQFAVLRQQVPMGVGFRRQAVGTVGALTWAGEVP
jgi:hypothetical protein